MNWNARLVVLTLGLFVGCREYRRPGSDAQVSSEPSARTDAAQCPPETECSPPIEPAVALPPITGGNLAAVSDGTWVVADADRATIWHLDDVRVLGQAALMPDDLPGRVLVAGTRAFVVLRRASQVAEFHLATHTLTRRETCTEPRGLALRGDELLVGCATGTIEVLSGDSRRTLIQSELLMDLRDLEVDGDRLLVSTFRNAQLFEVREGAPPAILRNPPKPPDSIARRFVPRVAWRLRAGLVVAQDQLANEQPSAVYGPPPDVDGGIVSAALYRVVGSQVVPIANASAVLPVDVAELGTGLFVTAAGSDELVRVDSATHAERRWLLPGQPTSLATSSTPDERLAVFLREPAQLIFFTAQGAPLRSVALPAASVFSTSHQLFHQATPSGLACATCHPEAGEDGHTWHLVGVVRRTPSLRGHVESTAPFHWSGDQDDLFALMMNVRSGRMGGQRQSAARMSAFAAWLDAQPSLRSPPGDPLAVERGRVLFQSSKVGCGSCHAGMQGTNNATANVGTGHFQVPRLRELAWRAPYFHDGRVMTLEARFLPVGGGELHGHVAHLTDSQRADLLAYLRSL